MASTSITHRSSPRPPTANPVDAGKSLGKNSRRTRRQTGEIPPVRQYGGELDHILQTRAGGLQGRLQVDHRLAALRLDVPYADGVPVFVNGDLSRNEEKFSALDGDYGRIVAQWSAESP